MAKHPIQLDQIGEGFDDVLGIVSGSHVQRCVLYELIAVKVCEAMETIKNQSSQSTHPPKMVINILADLWKVVLLIMATKDTGSITTRELIQKIPQYINAPGEGCDRLHTRLDPRFYRLVRDLKAKKEEKDSMFARGYATDFYGGFRITKKGIQFVKQEFQNFA